MTIKEGMLFDDYEAFVEKFKPKKTTDDCYTPPEVYDFIVKWVNDNIMDLTGKKVARPFKPGGDYVKEMEGYDQNTVVIDNPPFSILAEIKKVYRENGVKYFLFGPHLTIFGGYKDETIIIADCDITYENGAVVNTDFITNMTDPSIGIIVVGEIRDEIKKIQERAKSKIKGVKPHYKYPNNLITSTTFDSMLILAANFRLEVPRHKIMKIRRLDSQIAAKKAIFGGGISRE